MYQDAFKSTRGTTRLLAFILALTAGQAASDTPVIVEAPAPDRDANLLINGSFEEGHPGDVAGPPDSPSPDSVYWAPVDGGPHDPLARGDLSFFPPEVESTPPGWTGSGGVANYAEWSSQWPGFPGFAGSTGPALSTAPIDGLYSLYFGNYYMGSLDVPQHQIEVTPAGEWVFRDDLGQRVDPLIVPGQPIPFLSIPASSFRPEVRLSQIVTGVCVGARYRLSFTVFGEFGHPDWLAAFGALATDGFFGLEITGHETLYLNIPAGSGLDLSGNPSPFGFASEHTYAIDFIADSPVIELAFINWGHFKTATRLGGSPYQGPPGIVQTSELVLDDVILNEVFDSDDDSSDDDSSDNSSDDDSSDDSSDNDSSDDSSDDDSSDDSSDDDSSDDFLGECPIDLGDDTSSDDTSSDDTSSDDSSSDVRSDDSSDDD